MLCLLKKRSLVAEAVECHCHSQVRDPFAQCLVSKRVWHHFYSWLPVMAAIGMLILLLQNVVVNIPMGQG